jgi:CheY-like chemotaxis protein
LVVDDTHDTREGLAKLLQLGGYHTVCASNGREAIRALEVAVPAVILLDIEMPVMDGLSALRAIRQDPKWHDLPVVILSGNTDRHSVEEARRLGANDYLVKGTTPMKDVVRRVSHYASPSA